MSRHPALACEFGKDNGMRLLALALCPLWLLPGQDAAQIFYSKSFPGSKPAYVAITVDRDGEVEYREAPDDENPIRFQLPRSEADQLFALADKLDRFRRPLESSLKVAQMGMKTFRLENGPEKAEVQFNFTEDLDARLLTEWFERMSETEQHYINLERTVKYDRLGVNDALLLLQASMERKRLVAPKQFLPLLDRVTKNEGYLHMARNRAAGLATVIRAEP